MKIVVCAKNTAALNGQPVISAGSRTLDESCLEWGHNEWDLCAAETALRMREEVGAGEVIIATVGPERSEKTVRWCLAMGADRGIRIDSQITEPLGIARALAAVIGEEQPDLVLVGAQSSDGLNAATGGALAALLGFPFVPVVAAVELDQAAGRATVRRELEGGLFEMLEVEMPVVLSIQTGINDPRYVTLRGRKRAAEKPLTVLGADPSVSPASTVRRLGFPSSERQAQILSGSSAEVARQIASAVQEALI